LSFSLQISQICFQLTDAFRTRHEPPLKTNSITAVFLTTAITRVTLTSALFFHVATTFAFMSLVMLLLFAALTATLTVMTLSTHVSHLILPYELGMLFFNSCSACPKVLFDIRGRFRRPTLCAILNNPEQKKRAGYPLAQ
jgi:hypothetical protein